jgi:hypothetical protein
MLSLVIGITPVEIRLSRLRSPAIQIMSGEAARRQFGAEVLAGLIDLKERRHRSRTSSDISALDMRRDMGLHPTAI